MDGQHEDGEDGGEKTKGVDERACYGKDGTGECEENDDKFDLRYRVTHERWRRRRRKLPAAS